MNFGQIVAHVLIPLVFIIWSVTRLYRLLMVTAREIFFFLDMWLMDRSVKKRFGRCYKCERKRDCIEISRLPDDIE